MFLFLQQEFEFKLKPMMRIVITSVVLLSFFVKISVAQDTKEERFVLCGKVMNAKTKEAVSFAHINLDGSYWGTVADSLGFFSLRIKSGQSLEIKAMGFKVQVIEIQGNEECNDLFKEIFMEEQEFMLQEVDVFLFKSWYDFKQQFVKAELPDDTYQLPGCDFGNLRLIQAQEKTLDYGGFGFISLVFGSKKKEALKRANKMKKIYNLINSDHFNREIVAEITGEKGKRLDALMEYINSRVQLSCQNKDIYIVRTVKNLYSEFLQKETIQTSFLFADSLEVQQNHLRP